MKVKWTLKKIEYQFKLMRVLVSDDRRYKSRKFKKDFGVLPDLDLPTRFNEKVLCRMLFDPNPEYTSLADKIKVRKVVARKIGPKYLVPLVGIYEKFDDIDFNALPEKFVIKCSHDSGSAIVCTDKSSFSISDARSKINFCLARNMYVTTREKHYRNITPMILCEHYVDMATDLNKPIIEVLRVHCFGGIARFIEIDISDCNGVKYANIYDTQWNLQDVSLGHPVMRHRIKKPSQLEKVIELSSILSAGFDYCRIDWFIAGENIFFSEYTFTPYSGRMKFKPVKFDYVFGQLWHLTPGILRNRSL